VSSVDPRRSLELLLPEVEALNAEVARLSAEQWQAPSNCAGWQIGDLLAHVVRNGWSFLVFVRNALTGETNPAFGPAVQRVQDEIKAAGPQAAAERQARETDQFVGLVRGLSEADLGRQAQHPRGLRSVAWACSQRLVEVAFHRWDLRRSLGYNGPLNGELARHLLDFMLDPASVSIMTDLPPHAPPDTFRLVAGGSAWRVTVGPNGRRIEPRAAGPASLEIVAEPGWLALALYGRVPIEGQPFRLEGLPEARRRFQLAFGGQPA